MSEGGVMSQAEIDAMLAGPAADGPSAARPPAPPARPSVVPPPPPVHVEPLVTKTVAAALPAGPRSMLERLSSIEQEVQSLKELLPVLVEIRDGLVSPG